MSTVIAADQVASKGVVGRFRVARASSVALRSWAETAGVRRLIPGYNLEIVVVDSARPIPRLMERPEAWGPALPIRIGKRELVPGWFGRDGRTLGLEVVGPARTELDRIHAKALDVGASWEQGPVFRPHIALSHEPGPVDLAALGSPLFAVELAGPFYELAPLAPLAQTMPAAAA
jgi:hypothetical protein